MNCKECEFNNNGWCKKYKAQKPKAIVLCEDDNNKEDTDYDNQMIENQKYVINGKIQQFSNIIRQIDAEPSSITNEFKEVLLTLYKNLEIEIKIHGVKFDYETDEFALKDLRFRMTEWMK